MATLKTVRQETALSDCPYTEHRLRKMIKEGKCPGVRVGNRFMINHEMLLEYFKRECESNVLPEKAKEMEADGK